MQSNPSFSSWGWDLSRKCSFWFKFFGIGSISFFYVCTAPGTTGLGPWLGCPGPPVVHIINDNNTNSQCSLDGAGPLAQPLSCTYFRGSVSSVSELNFSPSAWIQVLAKAWLSFYVLGTGSPRPCSVPQGFSEPGSRHCHREGPIPYPSFE